VRDFAPITLLAGGPGLLVVHPSIPANNVKEFIAFAKTLQLSDVREKLITQGMEPVANTPAEFAALIHAEIGKWAKVAKLSGLKAE